MRWPGPYRVAAALLLFFAVTHTAGGLFGRHDYGAAGEAVFSAMRSVRFPVFGVEARWYDFWLGFGLLATVFLVLSAVIAWQLGGLSRAERRRLGLLCWAFFAAQVATAALSWAFFFPPPAVTATLVAGLTGLECLRDLRSSPAAVPDRAG